MVKCSECKYLEERKRVETVPSHPEELPGQLLHKAHPEPGPGAISPQAMGTISRTWFTCSKVNETISKNYGFQDEYIIRDTETNKDRDCQDFEK